MNKKKDLYDKLVLPVCALEDYVENNQVSPILDCIAMALRSVLDEVEEEKYNGSKE